MISKEEALHLVEGTRKRQHALIASAIMRKLAQRLGEDEERWLIVGLLHDLDYDMVQEDMTKHGMVAGEILAKKLNSESLYAIKSHDYRTGFKPKGKMDIALIVADTLAVIVARMATSRELSVQRIEEEIERLLIEKPWYKANLRKAGELGLERSEVLLLGMESMRSISGS